MTAPDSPVPTDLDTLRAALAAERQARLEAEAEARASGAEAMIAHLKLMIAPDVLARIADHPVRRLEELLPWNWHQAHQTAERTIAA